MPVSGLFFPLIRKESREANGGIGGLELSNYAK